LSADLDGTLIDSLADITTSVNLCCVVRRLLLPESAVTGLISEGVRMLVEALLVGVADLRNSFPSPAELKWRWPRSVATTGTISLIRRQPTPACSKRCDTSSASRRRWSQTSL
jgi:hypothetical protein